MKSKTGKPSVQKNAWRKKYGTEQGDLMLKYRAKIAAQAKHKTAAKEKRP